MRSLIAAVLSVALLVGVPTTAKATDSDWVMIVVEAGDHGAADLLFRIDGDARLTGSSPGAAGVASALAGSSDVFVLGLGATGIDLALRAFGKNPRSATGSPGASTRSSCSDRWRLN